MTFPPRRRFKERIDAAAAMVPDKLVPDAVTNVELDPRKRLLKKYQTQIILGVVGVIVCIAASSAAVAVTLFSLLLVWFRLFGPVAEAMPPPAE